MMSSVARQCATKLEAYACTIVMDSTTLTERCLSNQGPVDLDSERTSASLLKLHKGGTPTSET